MKEGKTLLEAFNLSKTYHVTERKSILKIERKDIFAVENISLNIETGKVIGLLGINGAGKTTTIKMLSSLIKPTSGEIIFDGVDCIKNPFELKKNVNIISGGERSLYWRLSAIENLEYFGALYNIPKKVLQNRIESLIEMTDIKDFAKYPVETYSKGMKQRLQFARGLINDPKMIFLDEPTLGLDVPIVKQIHGYIQKIVREEGKGILLTTHYMAEVEKLCDYVYILNKGKVILEGSPSEIIHLSQLNSKVTITLKRKSSFKDRLFIINECSDRLRETPVIDANKHSITISINKEKISMFLQILINQGLIINEIEIEDPKLEDAIFLFSQIYRD